MSTVIDPSNIQGDILPGLPKKCQDFWFFSIEESRIKHFRTQLKELIPLITTAKQVQSDRQSIAVEQDRARKQHKAPSLLKMTAVNIAFSQKGLDKLKFADSIGDSAFKGGMLADAKNNLGDDVNQWDAKFKTSSIDGVILITGSDPLTLKEKIDKVKKIFQHGHNDATIREVIELEGHVRPGKFQAHEHFGFKDGISQPEIKDFDPSPSPDHQEIIEQGVALIAHEGDNGVIDLTGNPTGPNPRPSWAVDGSFLCFRYLQQLVPEFDKFLEDNALPVPIIKGPNDPTGSELLGARFTGRWHSGAPVDLTPLRDDKSLSNSNDFRYDPESQERCPFAAHTLKMNPRDNLPAGAADVHRILRRGIQFGPEVTPDEARTHKSSKNPKLERGLLFVSYQSNIVNGFQFLQKTWANNTRFPPGKPVQPGFDPLIGIGPNREMVGTNSQDPTKPLELSQDWVVSRGGEYFFSPSIAALKNTFAGHGPSKEL